MILVNNIKEWHSSYIDIKTLHYKIYQAMTSPVHAMPSYYPFQAFVHAH